MLKTLPSCTIKVMVVAAANPSGAKPSKEQLNIFYAYSIFSISALFVFGFYYLLSKQNVALGWAEVAFSCLILANTLMLKIFHNYALACQIFLISVMGLLAILLMTGGIGDTGIFWYFTFPMCAFFLTGKRLGLLWSGALFLLTLAIFILHQLSYTSLAYNPLTLQQLLLVMLVVTAGIYVYQHSHEELLKRIEDNRRTLDQEKIKSDSVIDNIGEAVVVTDPNGRVARINTAAEATFGWRFSELKDKRFNDKIPVLDKTSRHIQLADAMQPMIQSLEQREKIELNTTYVRKDGTSFPASVTVTPIVVGKSLLGVVSTIRDISEEIEVDRTKSEFVTLASHQLRTPASAIAWTSELLLSGDVGRLTSEQKEYISKIYRSNKRLLDLLDDLLTVSSLELNSLTVTLAPTDIPSIVHREVATQLKHRASKKLHIKESYDEALPEVLTDSSAVKSIAQRLISNAIKYTPPNGEILVSVRHSHEQLIPESKGSVLIEITDTGYGIPKHQQAKVFTKLFRADNIKKKDTDGTGLGLYITKALVKQMNGKIWFTSEQNKGSQFSVLLPIEGIKK